MLATQANEQASQAKRSTISEAHVAWALEELGFQSSCDRGASAEPCTSSTAAAPPRPAGGSAKKRSRAHHAPVRALRARRVRARPKCALVVPFTLCASARARQRASPRRSCCGCSRSSLRERGRASLAWVQPSATGTGAGTGLSSPLPMSPGVANHSSRPPPRTGIRRIAR